MCREGAWIELTVEVTSMTWIQSRALGFKIRIENPLGKLFGIM